MRRMAGHDPDEQHRTATPLEGLLDLTFATCFGLAAAQFALVLSGGQYAAALIGFSFASFAICWAWINFSWFSSAYDTDDWIFRLVTMIQMIGVLVLAMGLPRMFASVQHGEHPDNSIMVLGYVIMRIAMVSQWLRAARQNTSRRRACLAYALIISVAQIGWVIQLLVTASVAVTVLLICVLATIELVGPVIAEKRTEARLGMRITLPNATVSLHLSHSAKESWVQWRRSQPSLRHKAGAWMRPWSALPA